MAAAWAPRRRRLRPSAPLHTRSSRCVSRRGTRLGVLPAVSCWPGSGADLPGLLGKVWLEECTLFRGMRPKDESSPPQTDTTRTPILGPKLTLLFFFFFFPPTGKLLEHHYSSKRPLRGSRVFKRQGAPLGKNKNKPQGSPQTGENLKSHGGGSDGSHRRVLQAYTLLWPQTKSHTMKSAKVKRIKEIK